MQRPCNDALGIAFSFLQVREQAAARRACRRHLRCVQAVSMEALINAAVHECMDGHRIVAVHCDSFIAQSLSFPSRDAFVMWCGGNTKLSSEVCERFGGADALLVPPAIAGLVQQQLGGELLTVRDGAEPYCVFTFGNDISLVGFACLFPRAVCNVELLALAYRLMRDRAYYPLLLDDLNHAAKPILAFSRFDHEKSLCGVGGSVMLLDESDPKQQATVIAVFLSASPPLLVGRSYNQANLHVVGLTTLDKIAERAFSRCSYLELVELDGLPQLDVIGRYAFAACMNLKRVSFNDLPHLTSIAANSFECCHALESLTFASVPSLQQIGDEAFFECTKLTSVDLSSLRTLEELGDRTFCCCTNLCKVQLYGPSLQRVCRLCFWKSGISDVRLVGGMREDLSIDSSAFSLTPLSRDWRKTFPIRDDNDPKKV